MLIFAALALTIFGCACFYLGSPNQGWLTQALPGRPALVAGSLLLAASLAAWMAALRPLAGFFVALHVAMVCLFAFPCLAALGSLGRKD